MKFVVANWKMNGDTFLVKKVLDSNFPIDKVEVIICPPYPLISFFQNRFFKFGAQDCHTSASGAYTGNVSASLLKQLGCSYVIIGHSERRAQHLESNSLINQKATQALAQGLTPIVCVGETLQERQEGRVSQVLQNQLDMCLSNIDVSKVIIAYEPVWAIGTGLVASVADIQEVCHLIQTNYNVVPILYGGSVSQKNAVEIAAISEISGVLVGGASLKVEEFQTIVDAFKN